MSRNDFKFYRFLYENMVDVSQSEYERCAKQYTNKLGTQTRVEDNNDVDFHHFIFSLNEIVPVEQKVLEGCIKRHVKAVTYLKGTKSREELIKRINIYMFRSVYNFNRVRYDNVDTFKLSNERNGINIGGIWVSVPSATNTTVVKPVLMKDLYGVYLNYSLVLIVDTKEKKIVQRTYGNEGEKVLFDYREQLQRHSLLSK